MPQSEYFRPISSVVPPTAPLIAKKAAASGGKSTGSLTDLFKALKKDKYASALSDPSTAGVLADPDLGAQGPLGDEPLIASMNLGPSIPATGFDSLGTLGDEALINSMNLGTYF